MANAEKIVDYVSGVLSNLIPKPADAVLKPLIKPVGDKLKAWLADKETQIALLEAAESAESDFREQAKEKFGNDKLTQAVASFPLYNGDLFQAALQDLPSHFNETYLANHISADLSKYWSGEFSADQIQEATALYVDCLRVRLLRVDGFADIVTRLAVLRTDRRTEDILEIVKEILALLSELMNKDISATVFRSLHQLSQPPADFTGRETLITELVKDFNNSQGATISGLTGMGGIGKTALGLKVAHKIADSYHDAQIFLDLKGTTEPLSALEIARHVILSFEPTMDLRTLDENNFQATYQSVLHGKKVLLFFDNARSADQIAPLRPPETCTMLVTSRWTFSVPGLHQRRVDVMGKDEAKDFLLELCPRIGDSAADLAKACAYLPLALRIAGSFLQVNSEWSIEKYLTQLNDRKQRLITFKESREDAELLAEPDLLATFELSYNQLSEEDQKRWRILGVFPASFASTAAGAMWKLEENETTKTIGLFRRYSLLEYDEASRRYSLHDLLTDYAHSQLKNEEFREASVAHALHYAELLGALNQMFLKGEDNILISLKLHHVEWVNIETGQHISNVYMEENQAAAQACNLYARQGSINNLRLKPKDQIRWSNNGLQASKILNNKKAEGAHLGNLGMAYSVLGETRRAIEYYEQNLDNAREVGNRRGESAVLGNLGNAYTDIGEYRKAIDYHEQALIISREIGDRSAEGTDLGNLGSVHHYLGNYHKALEYYEINLEIAQEIGNRLGESTLLGNMGRAYMDLGDAHKSIEYQERALTIAREVGARLSESNHLGNLGSAYYVMKEFSKAIEYYEQQLTIVKEFGDKNGEGEASWGIGVCMKQIGNFEEARKWLGNALQIFHAIESPHTATIQSMLDDLG